MVSPFRWVAILQLPFAFALNIAHAIVGKRAFPAVGLAALVPSAIMSLFLIIYERRNRRKISSTDFPTQTHPFTWFDIDVALADFILAVLDVGFLIPTWMTLSDWNYWANPWVILGTYASVFLIIDCCIHLLFALKAMWDWHHPSPHLSVQITGVASSSSAEYRPLATRTSAEIQQEAGKNTEGVQERS